MRRNLTIPTALLAVVAVIAATLFGGNVADGAEKDKAANAIEVTVTPLASKLPTAAKEALGNESYNLAVTEADQPAQALSNEQSARAIEAPPRFSRQECSEFGLAFLRTLQAYFVDPTIGSWWLNYFHDQFYFTRSGEFEQPCSTAYGHNSVTSVCELAWERELQLAEQNGSRPLIPFGCNEDRIQGILPPEPPVERLFCFTGNDGPIWCTPF